MGRLFMNKTGKCHSFLNCLAGMYRSRTYPPALHRHNSFEGCSGHRTTYIPMLIICYWERWNAQGSIEHVRNAKSSCFRGIIAHHD
jgi:hypothetical protein